MIFGYEAGSFNDHPSSFPTNALLPTSLLQSHQRLVFGAYPTDHPKRHGSFSVQSSLSLNVPDAIVHRPAYCDSARFGCRYGGITGRWLFLLDGDEQEEFC
jgi:hypothetical protein